jgi:hypothetical protein
LSDASGVYIKYSTTRAAAQWTCRNGDIEIMSRRVPVIQSNRRVGSQATHDADLHYFEEHPEESEYTRPLLAGEVDCPLPTGVMRRVRMGGVERRMRAFITPETGVRR